MPELLRCGISLEHYCTLIYIDYLCQCFSIFFVSRHPSLAIEEFGGTPGYNLLVNKCKVQKFAAPLELFTAPKESAPPKESAAPRLRTTDLHLVHYNSDDITKTIACWVTWAALMPTDNNLCKWLPLDDTELISLHIILLCYMMGLRAKNLRQQKVNSFFFNWPIMDYAFGFGL